MKLCINCKGPVTEKDRSKEPGATKHKVCPPAATLGASRCHDSWPRIRAELLDERSTIMRCLREIGGKLERGDLSISASCRGIQMAALEMENIADRASMELED